MYQHEEILKIRTQCEICGTIWQFQNIDNVAEKSIDHHYKSGECEKKYNEIMSVSYGQLMMRGSSTGTTYGFNNYGSCTAANSIWTNPPRGQWHYS